jgi:hypothetical protein
VKFGLHFESQDGEAPAIETAEEVEAPPVPEAPSAPAAVVSLDAFRKK